LLLPLNLFLLRIIKGSIIDKLKVDKFLFNDTLIKSKKNQNNIEMAEVMTNAPVNLTDGAVKQLETILSANKIPENHGLRIGVKGGGCSGFTYILGFDVKKENDQEFVSNGIKVFMEKSHGIYLLGMEIDFQDGLSNRGFSFNNPNATDSCGCGTSFSA
jgi:iron-sulfur cluster assembly protein